MVDRFTILWIISALVSWPLLFWLRPPWYAQFAISIAAYFLVRGAYL